MAKNKQRGYLTIETSEGKKTLHFSTNFLFVIEEITEKTFTEFAQQLKDNTNLDREDGSKSMATIKDVCTLVFAAMVAYDQEEENEIDYNLFKVRNWLSEALIKDPSLGEKIMEALKSSVIMGKLVADKKQEPQENQSA